MRYWRQRRKRSWRSENAGIHHAENGEPGAPRFVSIRVEI
jgi:hypothetical protein